MPHRLADLGFRFAHRFRVRYRDIDGQNIMFNSNYLAHIDDAVTEYWRCLGYGAKQMGPGHFDLALVHTTQGFLTPARLDDIVYIGVRIIKIGNTSFTTRHTLLRHDDDTGTEDIVMQAENIYVNYDARARQARRVPDDVRGRVQSFEGDAVTILG